MQTEGDALLNTLDMALRFTGAQEEELDPIPEVFRLLHHPQVRRWSREITSRESRLNTEALAAYKVIKSAQMALFPRVTRAEVMCAADLIGVNHGHHGA